MVGSGARMGSNSSSERCKQPWITRYQLIPRSVAELYPQYSLIGNRWIPWRVVDDVFFLALLLRRGKDWTDVNT